MNDYELMAAQLMIRDSRECVTRALCYLEDAKVSLTTTQQRLVESRLRIDLSDYLVRQMLISRREEW